MKISEIRLLFSSLTYTQKKGAVLLLFFNVVGVAIETLGVGAIIPALALVVNPELVHQHAWSRYVLEFLGLTEPRTVVIVVMVALMMIYAFKASFLAFLAWWEGRYTTGLQEYFADQFFSIYLKLPYSFHLNNNSSKLIGYVVSESGATVTYVITPVLKLFAESLIVLTLSTLLLTIEPLGTLVSILVLGSASLFYHRYTRAKVSEWGKTRQLHEVKCLLHLQQGLGGIKDVKILGNEEVFLEHYRKSNHERVKVLRYQSTMQQLPRLWIELLAVIGLSILMMIMMVQAKEPSTALPIVAVFAAAAFRLMPSLNRILIALNAIRFGLPTINTLTTELGRSCQIISKSSDVKEPSTFTSELEVKDLSFTYEGDYRSTLNNVNLKINRGEMVGIIGASGAGKSTLIDILLGLLPPSKGKILVDGIDIQTNLRAWQHQVGYVPQSIFLTDDSLRNNIAFGVEHDKIHEQSVIAALQAAQLSDLVASLPDGLDTVVGERGVRLSGGQRQRLGIARALYRGPEVIVLDEATSALDQDTEKEFMTCIEAISKKKTIVIVAHRLTTVARCTRVYRLGEGKVVAVGTPQQVIGEVDGKGTINV